MIDLIVFWLKSASKTIPMKLYVIQCISLQCDKSEEWLFFCGGGAGSGVHAGGSFCLVFM